MYLLRRSADRRVAAPGDHLPERGKLGSCGKPIAGASVRIVNPLGESLPAGEVGELVLKCRWMPRGYWKQPAASAAALAGGWYRTGDAATVDEEGFIYIRDRITDMIISGGENIFPAEVERVLAGHPDILDVAVIGVPDGYWGEAVKAVVVPRPGSGLGPELPASGGPSGCSWVRRSACGSPSWSSPPTS